MEQPQTPGRESPGVPGSGARPWLRVAIDVAWLGVLGLQVGLTASDPAVTKVVTASALVLLFGAYNLEWFMTRGARARALKHLNLGLQATSYQSEMEDVPNQNYLLAELRREMPRSRSTGIPFVLILFSLETLDEVRKHEGAGMGERAALALAALLRRVTRESDFFASMGGAQFCVMLNECTADLAKHYFKRMAWEVEVEGGERTIALPITGRMLEYDLEAIYATDVVWDLKACEPVESWGGGGATVRGEQRTVSPPIPPPTPRTVREWSPSPIPPMIRAPATSGRTPTVVAPAVRPSPSVEAAGGRARVMFGRMAGQKPADRAMLRERIWAAGPDARAKAIHAAGSDFNQASLPPISAGILLARQRRQAAARPARASPEERGESDSRTDGDETGFWDRRIA